MLSSKFAVLALAAALVGTIACGSSSSTPSQCDTLDTCCKSSSLPGYEVPACNATVSANVASACTDTARD